MCLFILCKWNKLQGQLLGKGGKNKLGIKKKAQKKRKMK